MKEKYKISVIVTVYNLDHYVEECIDSILAQTYKKLEIILVDDGSTDTSPGILDRYEKADARIRTIHVKNGGLVKARKIGVDAATGDYVTFVDADDWLEPDTYETFAKAMEADGADIITEGILISNGSDVTEQKNPIPAGYYDKEKLETLVYPVMMCIGDWYAFGVSQFVWNKCYRRELIAGFIPVMDEFITDGEDVAIVFPLLLRADSLTILDSCHYHYRYIAESMSRKKADDYYERVMHLNQHLEKYLLTSRYEKVMRPQLRQFILHMLHNGMQPLFGVDSMVNIAPQKGFDFRGIKETDRVLLYGAGIRGKNIYKKVVGEELFIISAWVDKKKAGNMICSRKVVTLEDGLKEPYDYVYVAIKDADVASEAIEEIKKAGVQPAKILWRDIVTIWDSITIR